VNDADMKIEVSTDPPNADVQASEKRAFARDLAQKAAVETAQPIKKSVARVLQNVT
jgi:hypothetical protein